MKRKIIVLMLCLSVGTLAFTSCGKKDKSDSSSVSISEDSSSASGDDSSSESSSIPEDDGIPIEDEEDVLACLELGKYRGLEVEKTVTTVTDQEVEDVITSNYSNTTVTDEPCQEGDTVYISYEGKMNGEAFEGGSTEGTSITLGASGYIDGFDDGVIGMKTGETKDLNLTFPDPYPNNEEFSGKPVVFTVTVYNISRPYTELTEEWVKKYSDSSSIEEYRAAIRKNLEDQAAASDESALKSNAWSQIMESTTIKMYQQSEIDAAKKDMEDYMTQYAQMMGTDLAGYIEQMGMSEEEYEANLLVTAKATAKGNMIIKAIAQTEGFTKDDSEYKEILAKTAEDFGMAEDALVEEYGQDQVDRFIDSERVMNVILDSATIKEVPAETKDSASAE
jgi:trigger factor